MTERAPTIVINLFGGANRAKTTIAWGVGYHLKMLGVRTELAPEYIKPWTYEGRKPNDYDQIYITGKQSKYESRYYGQAQVVVAECPVLLGGFYETHYGCDSEVCTTAALKFMAMGRARGVQYRNYWLNTKVPFDPVGRYGNEEANTKMHASMYQYLNANGVQMVICSGPVPEIVQEIVAHTKRELA